MCVGRPRRHLGPLSLVPCPPRLPTLIDDSSLLSLFPFFFASPSVAVIGNSFHSFLRSSLPLRRRPPVGPCVALHARRGSVHALHFSPTVLVKVSFRRGSLTHTTAHFIQQPPSKQSLKIDHDLQLCLQLKLHALLLAQSQIDTGCAGKFILKASGQCMIFAQQNNSALNACDPSLPAA